MRSSASSYPLFRLLNTKTSSSYLLQTPTPPPDQLLDQLSRILRRRDWRRSPYLKRHAPSLTPLHVSHLLSLRLDPQTALSFFHWISRRPNYRHTLHSYNTLLMSLSTFGMVDEMKTIFNRILEEDKFSPDIFTYSSMVHGYCKTGNLEEGWAYFKRILDGGLSPDTFSYNSLMLGYCRNRDLDGARKVFDEMVEKGCGRDLFSFNIMIQGLCEGSQIDEALVLFSKMGDDGCCPDEDTCRLLVKAVCGSERSENWLQFVLGDREEREQGVLL